MERRRAVAEIPGAALSHDAGLERVSVLRPRGNDAPVAGRPHFRHDPAQAGPQCSATMPPWRRTGLEPAQRDAAHALKNVCEGGVS
jgi:hypothetical protein